MLATDHAPHARDEKAQPMEKAPLGIVGSETAFIYVYALPQQSSLKLKLKVIAVGLIKQT